MVPALQRNSRSSPTGAPAPVGRKPFEYALIRVVPRVERGERFNAGIIVFSRSHRFLGARVELDEVLLRTLAPDCEPDLIRPHLAAIPRIAAGDPDAGPIARLSTAERFHWLVAPSSTMIQSSEVHTGLTDDPAAELEHLFGNLVTGRR
jgi:Protein of unknown function (DUF3037)